MIGTKLAHYEILSALGKGGMGEVWKARDTKLGREVAIKTLPEEFAKDTDRLARFEREAKLLASLNHPNIAAIYGLEEHEGTRFLVLELVEGDTLADRLRRGSIPVEESLGLAGQISDALEAAHEKGVIHRDLKPANIKVNPDGVVKVLDFGLAKAFAGDQVEASMSNSPTISMAATQQGIILGTAAYMSPEQASGQEVDKRTDVWAFGAVLFEMLTGQGLFSGETASHILASVLKTDPALDTLPSETPAPIRRLLRRCLEKDRKRRLHDIADARLEIKEAQVATPDVPVGPSRRSSSLFVVSPVMLIFGIVVGAIGLSIFQPGSPDPVVRMTRLPLDGPIGVFDDLVVSPDGMNVAYTRNGRLRIQHLDRLDALEVSDSDGAVRPFWSPDSEFVGYFAGGTIKTVSVDGGPSNELANLADIFFGATWGPEGNIVFTQSTSGLFSVSDQGGEPQQFLQIDSADVVVSPHFLPDGQSLLFVVNHPDGGSEIVVRSGGDNIPIFSLTGGSFSSVVYSPTGHVLYGLDNEDGIWAVPFSDSSMTVSGDRFPVNEYGNYPSVAADGTLVYALFDAAEQLVWVNRRGEVEGTIGQPQNNIWTPSPSPDGNRVAVQGWESGDAEIWIHDAARGSKRPFTLDPGFDDEPVWSPLGDQIAFTTTRIDGVTDIFLRDVEGTGEARPLVTGPGEIRAPAWSIDGSYIAFHSLDPTVGNWDVWYVEPTEGAEPQLLLGNSFNETLPQFSPDTNYVAYQSNQSGRWEVYLARFPSGEVLEQVSVNGGMHPRWSRSGDEVFFLEGDTMVAVTVETEPNLSLGLPQELFDIKQVRMRFSLRYGPL